MWIIAVLGIRDTRILGAHEQASQSETELQAQREPKDPASKSKMVRVRKDMLMSPLASPCTYTDRQSGVRRYKL